MSTVCRYAQDTESSKRLQVAYIIFNHPDNKTALHSRIRPEHPDASFPLNNA
jgi:hypothetical protein